MEMKEVRSGDYHLVDKTGRKRLSKVIRKLSGRFEEGGEERRSQPDVECRREGEDKHTLKFSFSNSVNGDEDKKRIRQILQFQSFKMY